MKHLLGIPVLVSLFLCLAGCSKAKMEDAASKGIWFSRIRKEVLYLDKNHSAFIRQGVNWYASDDEPTAVFRKGDAVSFPYRIENDRFIFEGDTYIFIPTATGHSRVVRYEEAYFDQSGNLVVQFGEFHPTSDGYEKSTNPNDTWESVFIMKDASFLED